MINLTSTEIQNLNQNIQQLYSLDNFDNFGVEAIQIMNQLVPSEIPSFILVIAVPPRMK
jgi:hypothetical protein